MAPRFNNRILIWLIKPRRQLLTLFQWRQRFTLLKLVSRLPVDTLFLEFPNPEDEVACDVFNSQWFLGVTASWRHRDGRHKRDVSMYIVHHRFKNFALTFYWKPRNVLKPSVWNFVVNLDFRYILHFSFNGTESVLNFVAFVAKLLTCEQVLVLNSLSPTMSKIFSLHNHCLFKHSGDENKGNNHEG